MAVLTIVGGLPGSGKSKWLEQIQRETPTLGVVVPDYKRDSIGHRLEMEFSKQHDDLIRSLREGKDCVIADVVFVCADKRNEIEKIVRREVPDVIITWNVFENNWRQCIRNLVDGDSDDSRCCGRIKLVLDLREMHSVPRGVAPKPVYRPGPEK